MRFITQRKIPAFIVFLVALWAAARPALAQTSWSVSTASELSAALAGAFANNVANPSLVNTITLAGTISGSSQWIVNANVNIVGNGSTIDMNNADRAFFIAGGTVAISNLTIQNGNATGGAGGYGAGGGAGLGGGIFIGSGTYMGWTTTDSIQPIVSALGISAPTVALQGVVFSNNRAVGGAGGVNTDPVGPSAGGGGGMGGNGGNATTVNLSQGGGGGGGFGNAANGGNNSNSGSGFESGGAGAFVNVIAGANGTSAGAGGNGGGAGGIDGGGGGSGALSDGIGSGGGGGVGGGRGYYQDGTPPDVGGFGGFGGGGGGNYEYYAGPGGFGGGGGAASGYNGGNGGFGGGGGNRYGTGGDAANSSGGFGGGAGTYVYSAGGAGMGAGGAVFVMAGATLTVTDGSFSDNAVTGGIGGTNGSAYGADLFLGENVAFTVSAGQTVSVSSLGGAGNPADPNVAAHSSDPNAQGGILKSGPGTLTLTGTSYYVGATTVQSGTLALGTSAKEQGTSSVTVAPDPGDTAALQLGSSSFLMLGGWNAGDPVASTDQPVAIAPVAGSTGSVVIGAGAGSSGAFVAARVFSGGAGDASVVFAQQYAAGSTTDTTYPFYTTLTGSLDLVQDGLGTTSLAPAYGPNTFVGSVTVNSGTLLTTGTVAALPNVTGIDLNGGALKLGQVGGIANLPTMTLAGGVLETTMSLTQNFGPLTVTGTASVIDFTTFATTFNFATLALASGSRLSIWNYAGADDVLRIATGTATGSLAQIAFYSDSGTTYLGEGGFVGTAIVPVPEPATIAMAAVGFGGFVIHRWRRRMRSNRGMRDSILTRIALFVICLGGLYAWAWPAAAQSVNVTTAGDLSAAIQAANAWTGPGPFTINFQTSGTIQPTAQMVIGLTLSNTSGLVINGNGATIDMAAANGGAGDRAFFIANGSIAMANLTIANGKAVGGNGGNAAGGGAGLGGGIFVANAASIPGIAQLPTRVSLTDVFFLNNQANGGNGGGGGSESFEGWGGGGGGMGGDGGIFYRNGLDTSGGGGGGFGFGANGGNASPDGVAGVAGAMTIAGASGGGAGGFNGAAGGAEGGGGGGGNDGFFQRGGGGGGGVGGQTPGTGSSSGDDGGAGGFGGGGGGGGNTDDTAGSGGFGGGGGSGDGSSNGSGSAGGAGGFGGGGGGNGYSAGSLSSPGGFGGGPGLANNTGSSPYGSTGGGGGAGLGGAVFLMGGASLAVNFSGANATPLSTNNAVSGGSGGYGTNAGSAYGPNVFLGGDVTYMVTSSTLAVSGLGGAGNVADPNVASNRSDPNANGGLVKNGNGTLALSGWNTYSGPTTVNAGLLATSGSEAAMMGTSAVAINSGATLALGQSNGVNANAGVTFNGGTLQLATTLTQTFAGFTVSQPSVLDFGSTMSALTMGTLSLAQPLAIWNFSSTARAVSVTSGTYSGSLSNVTFYSDAGQTSLGQTYLVGTFLTPQTINVANGADLTAAVASANAMTGSATIVLTPGATIQPAAQSVVSLNAANTAGLSIVGNNATIDMSQANGGAGDRAFFIAGGAVTMSDMTITSGVARGGAGADGGGGGAGLGGGIFVAAGNQIPSSTITLPTDVRLANVTFTGNTAVGGAGALVTAHAAGGGGGLGGAAGDTSGRGAGGGGGFGFGASGGTDGAGAPGAAVFTASGGGAAASGQSGGANGGGGGGSGTEERSGGGGGIDGASATDDNVLGSGGWGGGGGGASFMGNAGYGGFGGGGGGGFSDAADGNGTNGGWGGFGGGGGYGLYVPGSGGPGAGGFGGGVGALESDVGGPGGGGGMGAGGGVFVMAGATLRVVGGAFTANSVVSGSGNVNGSTYGTDLFLGANTTFDVPTTLTLRSLGGAGNVNDANVYNQSVSAAQLGEAQGGLIKTGNGLLTLTGTSFYSGITTVHSGTLGLAPGATEQGTTVVTVGQNAGDVATLGLASSSSLFLGGWNFTTPSASTDQPVMIAQAAGSTGTVVIGNGAGSNGAYVGARVFTGGAGNASVVFTQQYSAPGTSTVYPFLTTLTGTLGIVQDGLGTTSLQPLYGANTFVGPVTVNSGSLATTGTAAALAGATSIAVNAGGALALGQTGGVNDSAALTLAGGVLQTSVGLSETLGALTVAGSGSIIDFLGTASTLNFSSLSLGGSLAIWNYAGANDFVNIASGAATGSLAQIEFFSDSGSTLLGYGGFEGNRLVPVAVPEPATIVLALAGLVAGNAVARFRRSRSGRASPASLRLTPRAS